MEAEQIKRTILVEVGPHECVTCQRCATTFARVHPACPSCSQEFRVQSENERMREVAEDLIHLLEGAQMHALARGYRAKLPPADEAKP